MDDLLALLPKPKPEPKAKTKKPKSPTEPKPVRTRKEIAHHACAVRAEKARERLLAALPVYPISTTVEELCETLGFHPDHVRRQLRRLGWEGVAWFYIDIDSVSRKAIKRWYRYAANESR